MAALIKVKSIRAGNDTAPSPCSATSRSLDARVVKTTAYESAPFSLMPLKLIPIYNPQNKYSICLGNDTGNTPNQALHFT